MTGAGWTLSVLEKAEAMPEVEALQRVVWPGSETEVVPAHMLLGAVHSGGVLIGAFVEERLVGFVFGIPGLYDTPDGPRLKHYSHMLAVHPDYRSLGLGFALKRSQWQMVRRQGIDRITWTYDPLLSRNAWLNITRLGAVCNTYHREFYGTMQDGLNVGLPTDRFEVDWWVNSKRVSRRLSRSARPALRLSHYLAGEVPLINPTRSGQDGWVCPGEIRAQSWLADDKMSLLLVEIPADFQALKAADMALALEWRLHVREIVEELFAAGYLVTDFIHQQGSVERSYYVFSHGDSTL